MTREATKAINTRPLSARAWFKQVPHSTASLEVLRVDMWVARPSSRSRNTVTVGVLARNHRKKGVPGTTDRTCTRLGGLGIPTPLFIQKNIVKGHLCASQPTNPAHSTKVVAFHPHIHPWYVGPETPIIKLKPHHQTLIVAHGRMQDATSNLHTDDEHPHPTTRPLRVK